MAGLPLGAHVRDDEQALFLLLQVSKNNRINISTYFVLTPLVVAACPQVRVVPELERIDVF